MGCASSTANAEGQPTSRRRRRDRNRGTNPGAVTINGEFDGAVTEGASVLDLSATRQQQSQHATRSVTSTNQAAKSKNQRSSVTSSHSQLPPRAIVAKKTESPADSKPLTAPVTHSSDCIDDAAEQAAAPPMINPLAAANADAMSALSDVSASPHATAGLRGIRSARQYSESIARSEGLQLPGPALEVNGRSGLLPEAALDRVEDARTATQPHVQRQAPQNQLLAVPTEGAPGQAPHTPLGASGNQTASRFTFSWARAGSQPLPAQQVSPNVESAPNLPISLLNPGYNNARPPPILPPSRPVTGSRQSKGLVGMTSSDEDSDVSVGQRHGSIPVNVMGGNSANDDGTFELGPPSSIDPNHGARSNSAAFSAFGGSNFSKAVVGLNGYRLTSARDENGRAGSFAQSRGSMASGRGDGGMVVVVQGSMGNTSSSRQSSNTSRSAAGGFISSNQVLAQYEAATQMLSREGFSRRRELVMTYMKKSTAARVRAWIDHADHGETALGPLTNPQLHAITVAREQKRDQAHIQFGPPLNYQTLLQLAENGGVNLMNLIENIDSGPALSMSSSDNEGTGRRVARKVDSAGESFRE